MVPNLIGRIMGIDPSVVSALSTPEVLGAEGGLTDKEMLGGQNKGDYYSSVYIFNRPILPDRRVDPEILKNLTLKE